MSSPSNLIHFKPKHHDLLTDLGYKQNKAGFYNSQTISVYRREDMEDHLKDLGFEGQKIDDKLTTFKSREFPDLEIHFRKIDPIIHTTYVTSKNHEPSITKPKQRELF